MADPNSVNPYEQIWKTRDLRALETPLELENKLSSFERGVGRFKEQMKGTGYGLAALASQGVQNVIGENPVTQGITDWGLEGYNETTAKSQPGAMYAPKVARVEDIKTPSDALEWGAGLLGEQLPLAGSLLLTGGIGGAVARLGANAAVKDIAGAAVGTAVKKGVEQGALKAVEGQLVTDTMRKAASKALLDTTLKGAAITGFAGTAGMEGGLSFGGSVQGGAKPEDAVLPSIAVGGLNGALELLAPFVVAKKMGLGEYAKKSIADIISNDADLSKKAIALATAKELGTRGIKGFAEGAAVEGITEGLQELTSIAGERWAKNSQLFADLTDEDWSQIKNSAAGGAFIGGGLSGAGATVSGPQTEQTKVQTKVTVPAQSKLDVLKANQAKLVEQINEAIKVGDTKKAEELQAIKGIYDLAINKTQEVIPAQEKPAEEEMANGQVQAQTEAPITVSEDQALPAASEVKQEPLYSRPLQKPAPTFYSALERATQETKQEKAAPAQWESSLDNMVKKGLVKQEELDWSGTKEWLQEQKEPVTKEALLQHVRDNTLEVQETEIGNSSRNYTALLEDGRWKIFNSDGKLEREINSNYASTAEEAIGYATIYESFEAEMPRNTKWTLPGGEKQRELVLTAPSIEPFNTDDTTHYGDVGEGRAVAWVRFNDRVDENGKKILFLEEVQSKRHQEGKARGYSGGWTAEKLLADDTFKIEIQSFEGESEWFVREKEDGYLIAAGDTKEEAISKALNKLNKEGIPNAPFKQTIAGSGQTLSGWAGLAFKRMLKYAVENRYDKVAWTTGRQQAERYNLSNKVGSIYYIPEGEGIGKGTFIVTRMGQTLDTSTHPLIEKDNIAPTEIENYIGKELTSKLLDSQEKTIEGIKVKELSNTNLEIGGEGMKGFYDRLLPNEINKYVKKWGTKVNQTQMKFGDESASVHTVEVTPAMRDSVMQGQPLFSKPQQETSEFKKWSREYPVIEDAGSTQIKNWTPQGLENNSTFEIVLEEFEGESEWNVREKSDGALIAAGETRDEAITKAVKALNKNKYALEDAPYSKHGLEDTLETGKPFVAKVYHGSKTGEIEEFDPKRLGENTQAPSARKGFFFAGTPETASAEYYVGEPKEKVLINPPYEGALLIKIGNEVFKQDDDWGDSDLIDTEARMDALEIIFETGSLKEAIKNYENTEDNLDNDNIYKFLKELNNGNFGEVTITKDPIATNEIAPTVYPTYIRLSNPMVYDQKSAEYRETKYKDLIKQAKANNHDGLVILNTTDGGPLDNIFVVFDNKNIKGYFNKGTFDETGKLLESKQNAQQPGTITVPLQDFHANINSVMGEGWLQQAIDLGLVEVIEGLGPNGESGSWAGGKIRLYTGSMPKGGSPAGVLLHEGKHATFADVLGDSLQEYVKDLHTLAKNGNKVAQDAITHSVLAAADTLGIKYNLLNGGNRADLENLRAIIEARRPGLLVEEELAYFVQYGTEAQGGAGFLRRLINAIKAWFAQTRLGQRMKELGLGFELTDGMAVEWAKMGLNMSLQEAKQAARVRARIEKQAANMPASARLGKALEALENVDPLYSMGIKEMREQLWNDPTDPRLEIVNKPGLLQKFRADFVDFFAEMEKKSKDVYDTYILQRAKKGARIEKSRQAYLLPLRELIANSPWDAKEVGDMLAARHIKVDNVNTDLAQRASFIYTKELLKALPDAKRKELVKARVNVKAGKMPDGKVYKDANGNVINMQVSTKQKLMFDLMNQYVPFEIANTAGVQELNQEWEIFKDAAGGFSNGGIARGIVRTVDNVLAPVSKAPAKFDEIANLFDAMNRHTLDISEEGQLTTANEHARLLTSKSAYAPLRRESYNIDRETELLFQKASAGGSKQIGTRAGTANLSEPTLVLQNALAKLEATAAAAERNLANQELYNTIMTDREGWKPWFTIVDKDQYVTHDEDGFLQEKHATASNRGYIVLIKDGKKIVIKPNMHNERATGFVRAVNNMDVQTLNGPMKVMSWVNSLIRWTNISASPIFLMTNLIRDPLTAAYNLQATEAAEYSKDIFLNWKRAFKALKKVYIDNNRDLTDADVKMLEKFEKAGGRTSFVLSLKEMDDNSFSNFEGQVARRQGSMKYLMKAKDTWLDGIENYNILFENIMRFSTFMTLQEKSQGKISEQHAARIAQDITTNFSRRGYKSQMLGVWWLFFNASVQGNYQVLRNLMSSKRVQVAVGGTIATAVMLDVLGRALTDDWDEIPEWDKEKNIILPLKVGGDFVKIPAPWVYNVFWRMGGMIGETLAGKRKPQDTILDMAALTFTTLDPLGKPGSLAQAISPTAADPFVQILENKNFAGNPIGPEGYPGASTKANSELLWSTTPKGYQSFARFVNEATGGSAAESGKIDLKPGDYQLLADFLTGSFGKFLTDTTFGFANKLNKGIEGPKDIPIIKEFFSDPSNSMMVQKYHTNIATIYGAHRLEQMYVKGPERDLIKLQEVREERGNELRMYAQAQDVERQLKSLRVKLRAARNRKDTGREKELKERMNKVQEQFNKKFEQNVK